MAHRGNARRTRPCVVPLPSILIRAASACARDALASTHLRPEIRAHVEQNLETLLNASKTEYEVEREIHAVISLLLLGGACRSFEEITEVVGPEIIEAARPEIIEAARPEIIEAARPEIIEAARPEIVEAARPEIVKAARHEQARSGGKGRRGAESKKTQELRRLEAKAAEGKKGSRISIAERVYAILENRPAEEKARLPTRSPRAIRRDLKK
jgi:hypothetical protein